MYEDDALVRNRFRLSSDHGPKARKRRSTYGLMAVLILALLSAATGYL